MLTRKTLTVRRAAQIIRDRHDRGGQSLLVLMHFTDPKNFPNIGVGMWWRSRRHDVGYGDAVPTSTVGRWSAALRDARRDRFLTVVTAAITSTFIETTRPGGSRVPRPTRCRRS